MGRRIDLNSRLDEATHALPTDWDPGIARALMRRREQTLATRAPEHPASGTELIQARLAEARARQEAEAVAD
jgi:hypothetical protein